MKIFKFGGASVKDANGVKNLTSILKEEHTNQLVVVISAMGKMTNAFEEIVSSYVDKQTDLDRKINFVRDFHYSICKDLFEENHKCYEKVEQLFNKLNSFLANNASSNYNLIYDQIVSFGELLSTTIVSEYLLANQINNTWTDVRKLINTDATYRDAKVNWNATQENITKKLAKNSLIVTQGFLGGNENNTTTLGREGSDYTAGIFAYCLNAESVTIWKDVEGVLNADPRVFTETTLLKNISYTEAIEMAFYGASVIHPKTIQPLEQKNIPLYVRSFINPKETGTKVHKGSGITPTIPCFIVKKNQLLISIAAKDFSFIVEDNISLIFKKLSKFQLKVNLIQNSAIRFSVCVDDKFNNQKDFLKDIQKNFNITIHENVCLYTIRHYNSNAITSIENSREVLLKQVISNTIQLITKDA